MEKLGHCLYCGDIMILDYEEGSSEQQRNEYATSKCTCPEATRASNKQLNIERARERINRLFGIHSNEIGLEPLQSDTTRNLMYTAVDILADGVIRGISIDINTTTKAKITLNAKGKIEVTRAENVKYKLEA